jgi:hypothetical protein
MKPKEIQSGLGSKILVSSGAEDFDPDSMVELPEPQLSSALPSNSIVILTFLPTDGEEIKIAGILRSFTTSIRSIELEFIGLTEMVFELCSLFARIAIECKSCELQHLKKTTIKLSSFYLHEVHVVKINDDKSLVNMTIIKPQL